LALKRRGVFLKTDYFHFFESGQIGKKDTVFVLHEIASEVDFLKRFEVGRIAKGVDSITGDIIAVQAKLFQFSQVRRKRN
jgi:hypothetical protein